MGKLAHDHNFKWLRASKKVTKFGLALSIAGLILKGFEDEKK